MVKNSGGHEREGTNYLTILVVSVAAFLRQKLTPHQQHLCPSHQNLIKFFQIFQALCLLSAKHVNCRNIFSPVFLAVLLHQVNIRLILFMQIQESTLSSNIDDFAQVTWVFVLKIRYDVIYIINNFILEMRMQFGFFIKCIRTVNAYKFILQFYFSFDIGTCLIQLNKMRQLRENIVICEHSPYFDITNSCFYTTFGGMLFLQSH